jgi:hypothetical protein
MSQIRAKRPHTASHGDDLLWQLYEKSAEVGVAAAL